MCETLLSITKNGQNINHTKYSFKGQKKKLNCIKLIFYKNNAKPPIFTKKIHDPTKMHQNIGQDCVILMKNEL